MYEFKACDRDGFVQCALSWNNVLVFVHESKINFFVQLARDCDFESYFTDYFTDLGYEYQDCVKATLNGVVFSESCVYGEVTLKADLSFIPIFFRDRMVYVTKDYCDEIALSTVTTYKDLEYYKVWRNREALSDCFNDYPEYWSLAGDLEDLETDYIRENLADLVEHFTTETFYQVCDWSWISYVENVLDGESPYFTIRFEDMGYGYEPYLYIHWLGSSEEEREETSEDYLDIARDLIETAVYKLAENGADDAP
jgi:hypothetical protein